MVRRRLSTLFAALVLTSAALHSQAPVVTAIRAGRLLDPEAGRILTNQIIRVEGAKIREVGPTLAIPAGAQVIDLSRLTVMPGLVEDRTARDSGGLQRHPDARVGLHDCARHGEQRARCRHGIARGDPAGLDSRADDHQLGDHHRRDGRPVLSHPGDGAAAQHRRSRVSGRRHAHEIVKAVRQNVLFGARVIKICVDCTPYCYTADEIRLVIREAAKAGMKVEGHVQTVAGAKNAIDAGIWSIAHPPA